MIFLTVGTQLPFDRLIKAMDEIAPALDQPIFAQIGNGAYIPKNFDYCRFCAQQEVFETFQKAAGIVSHAGTGSMLTARRFNKPIILFPRRASLSEHRNDHQLATCRQLETASGITVAYDETELHAHLRNGAFTEKMMDFSKTDSRSQLGIKISHFINQT